MSNKFIELRGLFDKKSNIPRNTGQFRGFFTKTPETIIQRLDLLGVTHPFTTQQEFYNQLETSTFFQRVLAYNIFQNLEGNKFDYHKNKKTYSFSEENITQISPTPIYISLKNTELHATALATIYRLSSIQNLMKKSGKLQVSLDVHDGTTASDTVTVEFYNRFVNASPYSYRTPFRTDTITTTNYLTVFYGGSLNASIDLDSEIVIIKIYSAAGTYNFDIDLTFTPL